MKQKTNLKPPTHQSKWYIFFIILGALQIIGVVSFFLILNWLVRQAKAGVSGTEIVGLVMFTTFIPVIGIIAIINLIGLPIYLAKHRPKVAGWIFSIISLVISFILAAYGVYAIYQQQVVAPQRERESAEQLRKEYEQRLRQSK